MATIKALYFKGELTILEDYARPSPPKGEALIRVTVAGICRTDLEILKGYMGFEGIPGHEFCGVVEEINGDDRSLVGKRVVGEINCGCKNCAACLSGLEAHCPQRTTLGIDGRDGCLAEYTTLPVGNLHRVPDNVSDEEAVFTEPLASAFEIAEQVHIKPRAKIAVLGDGRLGILSALALNLTQADLTLVGKHREKLAIAAEQNVKTVTVEALDCAKKFDIVVEATGSHGGFELAGALVRPRGTLVMKSTVKEPGELNLTPLVVDEITLVGSRCGPFAPALRALENRLIDVKPLISKTYEFAQCLEAFGYCKTGSPLKVLIDSR